MTPAVRLTAAVGIIAVFAAAPVAKAEAKIYRHCQNQYQLTYLAINGQSFPNGRSLGFGRFDSRGGCGNTVPNRCRERARGYAQRCMNAHWAQRWDRATPAQCLPAQGVKGYGISDLKRQIEMTACCTIGAPTEAREVVVRVRGLSRGDNRCGGALTLSNTYTVDCRTLAFKACGEIPPIAPW